jgi:5-methylcytosine-specific restriction endonuclease McrA
MRGRISGTYKHTEETKNKIRLKAIGREHSLESREKMRIGHLGLKRTEEWKNKHREIMKGNKYALGYRMSEKSKQNLREKNSGKNSNLWKGGISYNPYSVDWTETIKKAIREKYKYTCQICGDYAWIVHHIDYDKLNCNIDNLIVVCVKCHAKTNFNRTYWVNYFNS